MGYFEPPKQHKATSNENIEFEPCTNSCIFTISFVGTLLKYPARAKTDCCRHIQDPMTIISCNSSEKPPGASENEVNIPAIGSLLLYSINLAS